MSDFIKSCDISGDVSGSLLSNSEALPLELIQSLDQSTNITDHWYWENLFEQMGTNGEERASAVGGNNAPQPYSACHESTGAKDDHQTDLVSFADSETFSLQIVNPSTFCPENNAITVVIPAGVNNEMAETKQPTPTDFLDTPANASTSSGWGGEVLSGNKPSIVAEADEKEEFSDPSNVNPPEEAIFSSRASKDKSSKCKQLRAQRKFVPVEMKDTKYWEKRSRNNESARKSRQANKAQLKDNLTDAIETAIEMSDNILKQMVSYQAIMKNLKDSAELFGLNLSSSSKDSHQ